VELEKSSREVRPTINDPGDLAKDATLSLVREPPTQSVEGSCTRNSRHSTHYQKKTGSKKKKEKMGTVLGLRTFPGGKSPCERPRGANPAKRCNSLSTHYSPGWENSSTGKDRKKIRLLFYSKGWREKGDLSKTGFSGTGDWGTIAAQDDFRTNGKRESIENPRTIQPDSWTLLIAGKNKIMLLSWSGKGGKISMRRC